MNTLLIVFFIINLIIGLLCLMATKIVMIQTIGKTRIAAIILLTFFCLIFLINASLNLFISINVLHGR
jgi:hypothetical protein